jgi:ubiquitin-protein ligase
VVDQYGSELPDAARPAVVDRVGPDGQGHRLDPNATLDESEIRDGDRMRVGFQARAAAVNPLDRQDALYRVRNQIRDFGDTREPETAFVVRANSVVLPTEYELEFVQPSFGPPPSPDAAPVDISEHRVLIQLGSDFPETPPMVFWLTQIFHPNVFPTYECEETRGSETQMGLVCLGALQESYLPSLHFGSLCQLLMDIAGFRNYNLYKSDGTLDATGNLRRQADFFDARAADWVDSVEGQRRIAEIKGSPLDKPVRQRPEYRNFIERIGGE